MTRTDFQIPVKPEVIDQLFESPAKMVERFEAIYLALEHGMVPHRPQRFTARITKHFECLVIPILDAARGFRAQITP